VTPKLRIALHQALDLILDAMADDPGVKRRKSRPLIAPDVQVDEFTRRRALEVAKKTGLL
jgi:hypothetical protein